MESVSSFDARGVSLTHPVSDTVWSFVGLGDSLTRPVQKSICSFVGRLPPYVESPPVCDRPDWSIPSARRQN